MHKNQRSLLFPTIILIVSSLSLYFLIRFIVPDKENIIDRDSFILFGSIASQTSGHALGGFIFSGITLYLISQTGKNYFFKCMLSLASLALGLGIGLSMM